MDTNQTATLLDALGRVPASGPQRQMALQRLTEIYADGEALAALYAAAAGGQHDSGILGPALAAASVAWAGRREPLDSDVADPAARELLRSAVASPAFLDLVPGWIRELREIAVARPGTGACTVATAMQLWVWTMRYFARPAHHQALAIAELADAFSPLLAARCRILEDAEAPPRSRPEPPEFLADLCHVQAARAASAVGSICAELVFGYRRHLTWNAEGCASCYGADALDELEGLIPGIASAARGLTDVVEADGSHAAKAGPCARFDDLETFTRLRTRLDGCLTGARLAKDRVAAALPAVLADAGAASRI